MSSNDFIQLYIKIFQLEIDLNEQYTELKKHFGSRFNLEEYIFITLICNNDIQSIKIILDRQIIDPSFELCISAYIASLTKNFEILKMLLNDTRIKQKIGIKSLYTSLCKLNQFKIVKFILKNYENLEPFDDFDDNCEPLNTVILNGYHKLAGLILNDQRSKDKIFNDDAIYQFFLDVFDDIIIGYVEDDNPDKIVELLLIPSYKQFININGIDILIWAYHNNYKTLTDLLVDDKYGFLENGQFNEIVYEMPDVFRNVLLNYKNTHTKQEYAVLLSIYYNLGDLKRLTKEKIKKSDNALLIKEIDYIDLMSKVQLCCYLSE